MTVESYRASRQVFHLKTDSVSTDLLRHDVLVRNGLVYRFSRVATVDFGMMVEQEVIEHALKAGVPAIPVQTKQTERDTYQWMRRARGTAVAVLPIEQKRRVWQELAAALRKLHTVKGAGAGIIQLGKPLEGALLGWPGYLVSQLPEHFDYARRHRLLDAETVLVAFQHLLTFAEGLPQDLPLSLLHGDLNDHNLFAQDGRLTDIIDWEDALIGDPIFELASWACFTDHPEAEWPAFFAAYWGGAETYCGDTDRPIDFWRRFWFYFLRIALSRLVQLSRYGFKDLTKAQARVAQALQALKSL